MADANWQLLVSEAEEALARARALATERPVGSPEREAARSMLVRLPEFIRDLSIARRRGRGAAAYRSVFEQLVTVVRSIG